MAEEDGVDYKPKYEDRGAIMWTKGKIKYYLCYWLEEHGHAMGYERNPEKVGTLRRRQRDGYFVSQAEDNVMMDTAFSFLRKFEQKLMVELYIDGSRDVAPANDPPVIWLKYGSRSGFAKKTRREYSEILKIENKAFRKMLNYLNPKEK